MLKSIVVGLALTIAAVTIASQEAEATKRCAPLAVQGSGGPSCKCVVQNYSTVTDTGVTIAVYAENGGFTTCGPIAVPPRTAHTCHVSIAAATSCGCVVTGEGALTYASLTVTDGTIATVPQTAVACQ